MTVRRRLVVRGVVQGVGFRPFVHRLATELGLAGRVENRTGVVWVEVEGDRTAVDAFGARLRADAPPLAAVGSVDAEDVATTGERGFTIAPSRDDGRVGPGIPPDVAPCEACLRELHDPADRRYRYPFLCCTDCGPRFTIVRALPYDRANTTMASFAMCDDCAREYGDPSDRRFHAEPIACPACGPRVTFHRAGEERRGRCGDDALHAARGALARGAVVAVKGVGGFHLACDARDERAVRALRDRKQRGDKPFAVMVADVETATRFAAVDAVEAAALESPVRPIVLLRTRSGGDPASVPALVAPGLGEVGVLLPSTPLHHLLLAPGDRTSPVLVMTSGNRSDEPIAFDDADARSRLGPLVDGWLTHDRPIHVPCDDSVVRVVDEAVVPVRRSRGYAPLAVRLPFDVPPTLAVGGDLKGVLCVAEGRLAHLGQHLGDLGTVAALEAFERSVAQQSAVLSGPPVVVAADAHPGYHSSRWAREHAPPGATTVMVQHHHAHAAALLAEHGHPGDRPVLVFAFDGTGAGDDGTVWGGEALLADYDGSRRVAHLACTPLVGGDAAVRHPRRVALAHLWAAGVEWDDALPPVRATPPAERRVLRAALEAGTASVATSSMGRLFDAVAALAGVRQDASYEAQAAMELEARAGGRLVDRYPLPLVERGAEAPALLDPGPLVRAVAADVLAGADAAVVSRGLHAAVVAAIGAVAELARARFGVAEAGCTGGVFQNALLAGAAARVLRARGLVVLTHRVVPPNDGGLALGQAAVAGRAAVRG